MSKITLTSLANFQNETTAVAAINANNAVVSSAVDNTLSRDGTAPNQMGSALDMNSNPIINLPAAVSSSSPLRLAEAQTIIAGTSLKTDANVYDTISAATIATIANTVQAVRTLGYTAIGDNGGGLYKRRVGAPAHSGYFQSADGAFWELKGPIVTLENFGAKGDGVTNDVTAVTNAFSSHVVIGAKLLGRAQATYKMVGAGPVMGAANVQFDGNYCTFEFSAIAANNNGFFFANSGSGTSTTIASNVAAGDTTIHLTAAVLATGDVFFMSGTDGNGNFHNLMGIVNTAAGTTVTLEAAIPPGLDINVSTQTYNINNISPSTRGAFKNCTINGTSCVNSGLTGFKMDGCTYWLVENLSFNGWGTTNSGACAFSDSLYSTIRNIYAYKSGSAGNSDINFSLYHSVVDGVTSQHASGFGPHCFYGAYTTYKNIYSIKANGRGIKTSGCLASNFDGLVCSNSLVNDNNIAIANGTSFCNFSNIVSTQAPGAPGGGACIWVSDQANSFNRFTNVLVMYSGWFDIFTGASDLYNSFDQVFCTGFPPTTYLLDTSGTTQWGLVNGESYNPAHTTTLVNDSNNNVNTSSVSELYRISGPTAGFTITGLGVAADGTKLTILNPIAQNMTIANDSGSSSVGNRILTLTGADVVLTGVSSATFRYSLADAHWILVGTQG